MAKKTWSEHLSIRRLAALAGRNRDLFDRYQDGESSNVLASAYGLSVQRVQQIVAFVSSHDGVALRPSISRRQRGVAGMAARRRQIDRH